MNKRDAGIIVAGSAFLLLALAAWLALFTTGTQAAAPNGLDHAALAAPAPPPAGAHAPVAAAQRQASRPGVPNVSSWVDIAPFPTVTPGRSTAFTPMSAPSPTRTGLITRSVWMIGTSAGGRSVTHARPEPRIPPLPQRSSALPCGGTDRPMHPRVESARRPRIN